MALPSLTTVTSTWTNWPNTKRPARKPCFLRSANPPQRSPDSPSKSSPKHQTRQSRHKTVKHEPIDLTAPLPPMPVVPANATAPAGAPAPRLSSSSEPHLAISSQPSEALSMEIQGPSTASGDLDSFDSGSRGFNTPRLDGAVSPAKYETKSGLRWNRVVPGERGK